jgi:sortase B
MAWEIFAVYYTSIDLPYIIPDLSWERFASVLRVAMASSIYNYRTTITANDKILTLSTCTYDVPGVGSLPTNVTNKYRFVIMAKLVDGGSAKKERASFAISENVMPVQSQPVIIRDDPEYIRIISALAAS